MNSVHCLGELKAVVHAGLLFQGIRLNGTEYKCVPEAFTSTVLEKEKKKKGEKKKFVAPT